MAEAVEAGILGSALLIDDTGCNLGRMQAVLDDGVAMLNSATAVHKHDVLIVPWTSEAVLAQCRNHHRRQRHGALTRLRLRPPDLAVAVGALAYMQLAA